MRSPLESTGLEIVRQYRVGLAEISIIRVNNVYKYVVEEPRLEPRVYSVYRVLSDYLSKKDRVSDDDIWAAAEVLGVVDVVDKYFAYIKYYIERDRGYGKLDVLFRDEFIEEIKIRRGPVYIVHREIYDAEWIETNVTIDSIEELRKYLFIISRRAGRYLSPAFPIQEFRLPEGHRVLAVYGDVSREPEATIRKFPREPLNILHIVRYGTLSPLLAALLWIIVEAQGFVLIIGPQGSGKTTLMAAFLDIVPLDRYVVTVEETPEIRLTRKLWTPLWVREPLTLSREAVRTRIGFRKLLKTALRTRAQYVAVSEARGPEIRYLFEAAALGSGSLATFHSGSIRDFEERLRLLKVPPETLHLLWCVVVMRKIRGVGYRLVELYEYGENGFGLLARWEPNGDKHVIVKKLSDSVLVRRAQEILGYDVIEEVRRRADAIDRLVHSNVFSLERLFMEVGWI